VCVALCSTKECVGGCSVAATEEVFPELVEAAVSSVPLLTSLDLSYNDVGDGGA
jgi:hypothetical protein